MASSIKALQQWCKIQCDGYRDVTITNMTTSFRDGLAFCALIHKHRPDVIDFDSLSKENVYENNNLAFHVAEEKLGIPALLDAEDMVALRVPDRLSILTYVSQYYNYFHGRSPIGGMAGIKRPAEDSKEQPAGKKNLPVVAKQYPSKPTTETQKPPTTITTASSKPAPAPAPAKPAEPKKVLVESTNKTGTLSSTCAVCKNHVHLVQRHLVDGKLYHRNCFRCRQCSNTLLSGTYKPGPESGTFICTTHQHNQNKSTPTSAGFIGRGTYNNTTAVPAKTGLTSVTARNQSPAVTLPASNATTTVSYNVKPSVVTTPAKPLTPVAEKTQVAREKFFQSSHVTPVNPPTNRWAAVNVETPGKPASSLQTATDKDKARSFLTKKLPLEGNSNNNNHTPLAPASSGVVKSPESQFTSRFGSKMTGADVSSWKRDNKSSGTSGRRPVSAFEPSTQVQINISVPAGLRTASPKISRSSGLLHDPSKKGVALPSNTKDCLWNTVTSTTESPADWRSKLKPVSKGPVINNITDTKDKPAVSFTSEVKVDIPSKPRTIVTSVSPTVRPASEDFSSTSARSVPPSPSADYNKGRSSPRQNSNGTRTHVNRNVDFSKSPSDKDISSPEVVSPKSRPHYIPEEKIQEELNDIEAQLNDLEKKGVEMEKELRKCEEDESEDVLMVDWFKLIRQKQLLMRRESELVYISKTQDLEDQQPGVEGELRRLMDKPEHLKTEADQKREEELMSKLVEIINDRNAIIDGLDEDRLREEEEDQEMNEMMQRFEIKKDTVGKKKSSPITKLFRRKSKQKLEETVAH
ncbi:MICAL-like protein 2 isoform X1 [Acipenser ruthenus]|uniref:MICAL-like protein 2 isoform X1 n=2 Tax=Acipenser ruthenus TaxID=7906 RepID=UPI0027416EC3|nr:MICAL-like protein 2 isoform X1 [Acipenser ruthenus]